MPTLEFDVFVDSYFIADVVMTFFVVCVCVEESLRYPSLRASPLLPHWEVHSKQIAAHSSK
jgi:hypothetical protein